MLYYTIYTPNFAKTAIHPGGAEYINNKSPPQCAAQDPTAKHRYFKATKKNKKNPPTTWFWSFYNDTRLPVEGLGQIWGGWKERGQSLQQTTGLAVAPGVKFIDFRQSHLHPYLRKHQCPFCSRGAIDGEECKMERDMSGWDGGESDGKGRKKKKKILLCKPDGFLWIKMSNWWKKAGCSETAWGRE